MPSSGVQTCRSEEHTSELQSHDNLVCRLLLEKTRQKGAGKATLIGQSASGGRRTSRQAHERRAVARHHTHRPLPLRLRLLRFLFFLSKAPPPDAPPFPLPAPFPF